MISSTHDFLTKLPLGQALVITGGIALVLPLAIEESLSAVARRIFTPEQVDKATPVIKTVAVFSTIAIVSMIAPQALLISFTAAKIFSAICIAFTVSWALEQFAKKQPGALGIIALCTLVGLTTVS
jgi:hypothetical protein